MVQGRCCHTYDICVSQATLLGAASPFAIALQCGMLPTAPGPQQLMMPGGGQTLGVRSAQRHAWAVPGFHGKGLIRILYAVIFMLITSHNVQYVPLSLFSFELCRARCS